MPTIDSLQIIAGPTDEFDGGTYSARLRWDDGRTATVVVGRDYFDAELVSSTMPLAGRDLVDVLATIAGAF